MEAFNLVAGVASILGVLLSGAAAFLAKRASKAAAEAREAAAFRSLGEELDIACTRAEQLVDFLAHDRLSEATLRAEELTSSLSELPYRRSPFLTEAHINQLLTLREQLSSIAATALEARATATGTIDTKHLMSIARRVVMSLREILGGVRSNAE